MARRITALVSLALVLAGLGIVPAAAMGSGNPYEDLQVGVGYAVYQPGSTSNLRLAHAGAGAACPAGTEQNMVATYGSPQKTQLTIIEGSPLCSDPAGVGKTVVTTRIDGARAIVQAWCPEEDFAKPSCNVGSVSRLGGSLQVTLPAVGGLRSTSVVMTTSGKKPLSAAQLVKIARSMSPVATNPQLVGGMVTCTQNDLANAVEVGLRKGTVLVSVDAFNCADGWAYAIATTGDGKGHNITQTFVFEAEGQFWIPKDRSKVCGTINVNAPAVRPADSQVPAAIWTQACNTN